MLIPLLITTLVIPWIYNPKWIQSTQPSAAAVIPIYLEFGDAGFNFPDLAIATQRQLDSEIQREYPTLPVTFEISSREQSNDTTDYAVDLCLSEDTGIVLRPKGLRAILFYTLDSIHSNDLPFLIAQTILFHLLAAEVEILQNGVRFLEERLEVEYLYTNVSLEFKEKFENVTNEYMAKLRGVFNIHHTFADISKRTFRTGAKKLVLELGTDSGTETKEMLAHVVEGTENSVERKLGLPVNPTNNLDIKLVAVKRTKENAGAERMKENNLGMKRDNNEDTLVVA